MKTRLVRIPALVVALSTVLTVGCAQSGAPTPAKSPASAAQSAPASPAPAAAPAPPAAAAKPAPQQAKPAEAKAAPARPAEARPAFPTRPVRIVVTHAAGGGTDNAIRFIQPYLQSALGQPVVVENMAGAGGNIARSYVFKQPPDGYTLVVSQFPSMMIGEVTGNAEFKTLEMTPVFHFMGQQTQGLMVLPTRPWKTLKELMDESKGRPLNMAGAGQGTNSTLAYAMYRQIGLNAKYIPFNSGTESATALLGGHVDASTDDSTVIPRLGKDIRVLAVTGRSRNRNAPDAPTLLELGHKDMGFDVSIGVMGPPGLPADILAVFNAAFTKAASDPDFQDKARKGGYEPEPLDSAKFGERIKQDFALVKQFQGILNAK